MAALAIIISMVSIAVSVVTFLANLRRIRQGGAR